MTEYHLKCRGGSPSVSLCRVSVRSMFGGSRGTNIVGLVTCRPCLETHATNSRADAELANNEIARVRARLAKLEERERTWSLEVCACGHVGGCHVNNGIREGGVILLCLLDGCDCPDYRPSLET